MLKPKCSRKDQLKKLFAISRNCGQRPLGVAWGDAYGGWYMIVRAKYGAKYVSGQSSIKIAWRFLNRISVEDGDSDHFAKKIKVYKGLFTVCCLGYQVIFS